MKIRAAVSEGKRPDADLREGQVVIATRREGTIVYATVVERIG